MKAKAMVPQMRRHSSGQARVRFGGATVYLGTWGSVEAAEAYARVLRTWERSGRTSIVPPPTADEVQVRAAAVAAQLAIAPDAAKLVDELSRAKGLQLVEALAIVKVRRPELFGGAASTCTLAEAVQQYEQFLDESGRYVKRGRPTNERSRVRSVLAEWVEHDGARPIGEVDEALVLRHRDRLEKAVRLTRAGVNRKVAVMKRALRWLAKRAILPRANWAGIAAVESLKRGELPADRERKATKRAVARDEVEHVAVHATPTIAAMLRLQAITGARPGEVCLLRWQDIDKKPVQVSGVPCWRWIVNDGKTAHHGGRAVVYCLPPAAQRILEAFGGHPASYVFSPARHVAELRRPQAQKAAARYGQRARPNSRRDAERRANPRAEYRAHFTTDTYGRAALPAMRKAGVRFGLHEIRHGVASRLAAKYGVLAAQAALGHTNAATTSRYLHADEAAGWAAVVAETAAG